MTNWRSRLGGIAVAIALTLSACGAPSPKQSQATTDRPLKLGALTAPTDTLDPNTLSSPGGYFVALHLYDSLVSNSASGLKLSLAESITPNETADAWRITLRDGLTYSDGTPATGQDVLDSLAHLVQSPNYASLYSIVDFTASSAEGNTATVKLTQPASDFLISSLAILSTIAPKGKFDGVGAGPYVLDRGDASTGYQLSANPKYWNGKPAISKVEVLPIPDSAAQAEAIKAGEIDVATGLNSAALATLNTAEQVVVPEATLHAATALDVVLNTRVAPFNDPETRRAAKLTLDREKMVHTLLGESGEVGNDMLGKGYDTYPDEIAQVKADKAKAKQIFADKGITEFTIVTSDIMPGLVASAEMMAQEFAEVGVKVHLEKRDPQTFFADLNALYETPAFTMYWVNRPPANEFRMQAAADSAFNLSGYSSAQLTENLTALHASLDPARQAELVAVISQEIHDQGGDLIWGYQKQFTAHHAGLTGAVSLEGVWWLADATFSPR